MTGKSIFIFTAQIVCCFLLMGLAPVYGETYDPLSVSDDSTPRVVDLIVMDQNRDREIPVRVYLPATDGAAPVVIFSHGLGGSREGNSYIGNHWAARGYFAVFLQHHGSDTAVWLNVAPARRMQAMREAASARNFLLRVGDVPAVLDQLDRWNSTEGHLFFERLDMQKVGMSGHSFGAVTTQAVSGQSSAQGKLSFLDSRILAAVIMSPSKTGRATSQQSFGNVPVPWMLMTGTNDISPVGDADMDSRLAVFPALPAGGKYELVLFEAEHSAFTDRDLSGKANGRNPNHHRAILALSTAFWDAYLFENAAAQQWLDGDGPRSVLEPQDRWQTK